MNEKLKELHKQETFKHPTTNRKLKSVDNFTTDEVDCVNCNVTPSVAAAQSKTSKVYLISSDRDDIAGYIVVQCLLCNVLTWYIRHDSERKSDK